MMNDKLLMALLELHVKTKTYLESEHLSDVDDNYNEMEEASDEVRRIMKEVLL